MGNEEEIKVSEGTFQDLSQNSNSALTTIIQAEIDTAIATAKKFPRNITTFMKNAFALVTRNEDIAASCSYAVPRGDKTVDGASVRLAEICCATYGNIKAGARVIKNDGKYITAQGIAHDLESNYGVSIEYTGKITTYKNGGTNDTMITQSANRACAIAYRNAVYKVIPFSLVSEIYEEAKRVSRGDEKTLKERLAKAVEYFKNLNVTEEQICRVLEVESINNIDLDKLQTLRGIATAIKTNESTVDEIFYPSANYNELPDNLLYAIAIADKKKLDEIWDLNYKTYLHLGLNSPLKKAVEQRRIEIESGKSSPAATSSQATMPAKPADSIKHLSFDIAPEKKPTELADSTTQAAAHAIEIGDLLNTAKVEIEHATSPEALDKIAAANPKLKGVTAFDQLVEQKKASFSVPASKKQSRK